MSQTFASILAEGGHTNSLGRTEELVQIVLADKSRLEELYLCMFDDDAWVRMRAADGIEKVCRVRPEWIKYYTGRFIKELSNRTQPSIQWHLAQIYRQVELSDSEGALIIKWLKRLISTVEVDWIVSANVMETLVQFAEAGQIKRADTLELLKIQKQHKSKSVVRRADKMIERLKA